MAAKRIEQESILRALDLGAIRRIEQIRLAIPQPGVPTVEGGHEVEANLRGHGFFSAFTVVSTIRCATVFSPE